MTLRITDAIPGGWERLLAPTGRVSIGLDIASTKNKKSNPSALAVMQKFGNVYNVPLELRWKTDDAKVFASILKHTIKAIPPDLRGKLVIDSSNEKLTAMSLKRGLSGLISCLLVAGNDVLSYKDETFQAKVLLGCLLCDQYEDRTIAIPNAPWLLDDHRLVNRDGASFTADVDSNGCHADNFDAEKLALWGLVGAGGKVEVSAVNTFPQGNQATGQGINKTRLERMADIYKRQHNF